MRRILLALLLALLPVGLAGGDGPQLSLTRAEQPATGPAVRSGAPQGRALYAPEPSDSVTFVVYGDRTHGLSSGLDILRQIVTETNRLDPDFVVNVGDMVNGYYDGPTWIRQMEEYKEVLSGLNMPWYPTPGNHDVYGQGGKASDRSNEARYREHFGPLYYSFDYRWVHFVVLYSDEMLSFKNPPLTQNMTRVQMDWLEQDLAAAKNAKQVFVFLHHPRWNRLVYPGTNWPDVHSILKKDGRVRAVFAGHLHNYRYDGEQDGIRYYTLAATGANIGPLYEAGQFHHIQFVRVRPDRVSMSMLRLGATETDEAVQAYENSEAIAMIATDKTCLEGSVEGPTDELTRGKVILRISNPTRRDLDFDVTWSDLGDGWEITPPERKVSVAGKSFKKVGFDVTGIPLGPTESHPNPKVRATTFYTLRTGRRQELYRTFDLPVEWPEIPAGARDPEGAANLHLALDGENDCIEIPSTDDLNVRGPFTAECRVRAETTERRQAILGKTENSAWSIFLSDETSSEAGFFLRFTKGGYERATFPASALADGKWHHVAGTWDGERMVVWLDGRAMASTKAEGKVQGNSLPLYVGADPTRGYGPQGFLEGAIDEVRVSNTCRYSEAFTPADRFEPDEDTALLLHFDCVRCNHAIDASGRGHHGIFRNGARIAGYEK